MEVTVYYGNQKAELPLIVVSRSVPSLFGHYWLHVIKLDRSITYADNLKVLDCHKVVLK